MLAKSSVDSTWFATYGVSWSHDGRFISATQETIVGGYRIRPVVVDATTGEIKTVGVMTWPDMGRTAWLPGNAILLSARERAQGPYQFTDVGFSRGRPLNLRTRAPPARCSSTPTRAPS